MGFMAYKVTFRPGESGNVPEPETFAATSVRTGDVWIEFSTRRGDGTFELVGQVRASDVERIDKV